MIKDVGRYAMRRENISGDELFPIIIFGFFFRSPISDSRCFRIYFESPNEIKALTELADADRKFPDEWLQFMLVEYLGDGWLLLEIVGGYVVVDWDILIFGNICRSSLSI